MPRPTSKRIAAVALKSGFLPPTSSVLEFIEHHCPGIRVYALPREADDASAERVLHFDEGECSIGAAHFPWQLERAEEGGILPRHVSHVWLTATGPDARKKELRKLLARASAAISECSDTSFVWWGPGKKLCPKDFFLRQALKT